MKEIQLSKQGKNKGKFIALVDDEDFEYLNQFRWFAHEGKNTFYAYRTIRIDGKQSAIYMHGVIMGGKLIDHRDHNGLNNQRSNLRFCTNAENNMNNRKRANTTSIYKGVSHNKRTGKWESHIKINGKKIHIGHFINEVDAARAYNKKAIELFCEFANLNVIV